MTTATAAAPATAPTTAVTRSDSTESLTGRQKAAILCMTLGAEVSSAITQKLSGEEVEAISLEIAKMDQVPPSISNAVLVEWLETARAADSLAGGGVDYAQQILEQAFGAQKASYVFKRIQAQISDAAGLYRLRKVDSAQLGNLLRGEHPQTIALILAHLDPQHTAAVLKELGTPLGGAVVYRMACMEKVSPDMLQMIERSLGGELELSLSQGMSASGGPRAVAAVLNLIAPSMEKELLDGLASEDEELCDQIKNLMFVFEDIVALDARAMQRVLREVESRDLALALKAASPELKAKILGSMSNRAVEAVEEEIEMLGPVRVRDVEAAQVGIVARVRSLEEAGEIVIAGGGDDELI